MACIEKRVNAKGVASYRVKVSIKGYPLQTATFRKKLDANKWANQTEDAIRNKRYFKYTEAKTKTLKDAIAEYKKVIMRVDSEQSYDKTRVSQLNWWSKEIGNYFLGDIDVKIICECREKLIRSTVGDKPLSGSTINRYLAALSHLFSVCVNQWEWLQANPVKKVMRLKENTRRERRLTDIEQNKLLEACATSTNVFLMPIVLLAIFTGARKSEISNLKWENINFEKRVIYLVKTKNGVPRQIPMTELTEKIFWDLKSTSEVYSDYVFPSPNSYDKPINWRWSWEQAVKRANLPDFHFHDLRHGFSSMLCESGANLIQMAELLGHKTLDMVKYYSHVSLDNKRVLLDKIMNKDIFAQLGV